MIGLLLVLLSACGRPFECCDDGVVSTCVCPVGANCAENVPYTRHEDGTCELGTGDTADTATTDAGP